eukprot:TRINITY_DN18941_c0_g1_i1.p1 TRINITY_DN18941_c0_g1~~TRINITY_DN18941_c0_g1_i1.p1  ORF type:complete len:474 (+),score=86.51 TRINITY_DN18941_c0_g1_i1:169-1422(+)
MALVTDQLDQLRQDMAKLTAAADEAKRNGDDDTSKFKLMLAGDIRDKIQELEEKQNGTPPPIPSVPLGDAAWPPFLGGCGSSTKTGPNVSDPLPFLPPPLTTPGGLGSAAGSLLRPPTLLGPRGLPPMLPPSANAQALGLPPPPLGAPGMLPTLPPFGAPIPPLPRPGGIENITRMMALYENPEMAVNITQQQALEYEQAKANSMNVEPEVLELAHHFNLSDRHARLLDEQLKKRNNTYEDDIAAMYEILKGAKNPADLLMVSIRWMAEGVFRGVMTPNPDVEKAAKMYKLDAPSACKLAEVLETRKNPEEDLRRVCSHLERSNKPSSLVMMMLKDLKAGHPVEESTKQPAIGSYLHKEETKRQQRRSRSRGRGGRSRSRGRGRSRSRGRGGGRSRSRGRGVRSRSRGRGRSRSRGR